MNENKNTQTNNFLIKYLKCVVSATVGDTGLNRRMCQGTAGPRAAQ